MATRDQPCAQHPEATCDYAITSLFNSHYFIVVQDEGTGRTVKPEEVEADW